MKTITCEIKQPIYSSKTFDFYFKGMNVGVLDIETTGLDPNRCHFILGGLLVVSENTVKSLQFFAENIDEEREALTAYLNEVNKMDVLITYNGDHFDIPFIKRRARGFCSHLPYSLDLYKALNKYSSLRKFLPNLKQKTVENFMGLWHSREDEITGKESVELYQEYTVSQDPSLGEKILLHNKDDICQLYRLLAALQKCDLHKALYHMGFPVTIPGREGQQLQVTAINLAKTGLFIEGKQCGESLDYREFDPFSVIFDQQRRKFQLEIPLIHHQNHTLVDLNKLGIDVEAFSKYPTSGEGLLIVAAGGTPNYLEINHLTKIVLERNPIWNTEK